LPRPPRHPRGRQCRAVPERRRRHVPCGDPMSEATGDDRAALRDLAERYATGVDRRDTELFLSAFHLERGCLLVFDPSEAPEPRGTRRGRDELAGVIALISRHDRTFHLLGNSRYEVSGDGATGEVY